MDTTAERSDSFEYSERVQRALLTPAHVPMLRQIMRQPDFEPDATWLAETNSLIIEGSQPLRGAGLETTRTLTRVNQQRYEFLERLHLIGGQDEECTVVERYIQQRGKLPLPSTLMVNFCTAFNERANLPTIIKKNFGTLAGAETAGLEAAVATVKKHGINAAKLLETNPAFFNAKKSSIDARLTSLERALHIIGWQNSLPDAIEINPSIARASRKKLTFLGKFCVRHAEDYRQFTPAQLAYAVKLSPEAYIMGLLSNDVYNLRNVRRIQDDWRNKFTSAERRAMVLDALAGAEAQHKVGGEVLRAYFSYIGPGEEQQYASPNLAARIHDKFEGLRPVVGKEELFLTPADSEMLRAFASPGKTIDEDWLYWSNSFSRKGSRELMPEEFVQHNTKIRATREAFLVQLGIDWSEHVLRRFITPLKRKTGEIPSPEVIIGVMRFYHGQWKSYEAHHKAIDESLGLPLRQLSEPGFIRALIAQSTKESVKMDTIDPSKGGIELELAKELSGQTRMNKRELDRLNRMIAVGSRDIRDTTSIGEQNKIAKARKFVLTTFRFLGQGDKTSTKVEEFLLKRPNAVKASRFMENVKIWHTSGGDLRKAAIKEPRIIDKDPGATLELMTVLSGFGFNAGKVLEGAPNVANIWVETVKRRCQLLNDFARVVGWQGPELADKFGFILTTSDEKFAVVTALAKRYMRMHANGTMGPANIVELFFKAPEQHLLAIAEERWAQPRDTKLVDIPTEVAKQRLRTQITLESVQAKLGGEVVVAYDAYMNKRKTA